MKCKENADNVWGHNLYDWRIQESQLILIQGFRRESLQKIVSLHIQQHAPNSWKNLSLRWSWWLTIFLYDRLRLKFLALNDEQWLLFFGFMAISWLSSPLHRLFPVSPSTRNFCNKIHLGSVDFVRPATLKFLRPQSLTQSSKNQSVFTQLAVSNTHQNLDLLSQQDLTNWGKKNIDADRRECMKKRPRINSQIARIRVRYTLIGIHQTYER